MNTTTNTEQKEATAREQARGAYQRALNRGWNQEDALAAAGDAYETWMQD